MGTDAVQDARARARQVMLGAAATSSWVLGAQGRRIIAAMQDGCGRGAVVIAASKVSAWQSSTIAAGEAAFGTVRESCREAAGEPV